jgi:hypothetical protein
VEVVEVPVQPGDIGLVTTSGLGPNLIRYGDAIYARRLNTKHETCNHVVVSVGNGLAVGANPNGAAIAADHSWSRTEWRTYRNPLTPGQRAALAGQARALVGTPYSWLDIVALTLEQLGWNTERDDGKLTRIGRRLNNNGQLVCSQLAALVYQRCGLPLFIDRSPGETSPGDLARTPLLVPVT